MAELCPFCLENGALKDKPLYVGSNFFVLGMLDPSRQNGVMIIPRRHVETPFALTSEEFAALPEALAVAKKHHAHIDGKGFTIGWNVGAVAGQTVAHVHLHVVARLDGEPASYSGLNGLLKLANREQR